MDLGDMGRVYHVVTGSLRAMPVLELRRMLGWRGQWWRRPVPMRTRLTRWSVVSNGPAAR